MAGNLKEQKIPTEVDSSRQQSFQQSDPNYFNMQQAQDGQLPPAYAPSPTAAPMPIQPQFQQPQQAHFQQGQFAEQPQLVQQPLPVQPQQQFFIQLPNGQMQAVSAQPGYGQPMPHQHIMMTPTKEQPTIVINNTPSASAAAAGGGGGGGGGGSSGTDACLAGFCGGTYLMGIIGGTGHIDEDMARRLLGLDGMATRSRISTRPTASNLQVLPSVENVKASPMEHPPTAKAFESLPREIFDLILHYSAGPVVSLSDAVGNEPSFSITSAEDATLKAASLVSHAWRRSVLPALFKHTRLILRDSYLCSFDLKRNVDALVSFLKEHDLAVSSFLLGVYNHDAPVKRVLGYQPEEYQDVWEDLFGVIDPRAVTIVAPPRLLGDVTGCVIDMEDADMFNIKYQILHVSMEQSGYSRKLGQSTPQNYSAPISQPRGLFQIRPWTSVLLNEGSHMEVIVNYPTPRHHRAPSLLNSLLITPLFPATATNLTYVAIFPLCTHIQTLAYHFPAVRRLSLHLSPKTKYTALFPDGPTDGIDGNQYPEVILQEWFQTLMHLAKYFLWDSSDDVDPGNWLSLKELVSPDFLAGDFWAHGGNPMAQIVVYAHCAEVGWRVGQEGILVRD
ncbi:hypothetical protein V492_03853 [Pseudogymnoascus sp. VKM F-4246]|nr:hypothetical protein V492_03853 [Pseudogymnoascus sp. VKM F-4246]